MDTLLPRFAALIAAATPQQISADPSLDGHLELTRDGAFSVCYAPFDHVNATARVVLVGITPGRQQAVNALLEANRQMVLGKDLAAVAKAAKETASFSGSMRSSLVGMLDHIGLGQKLGIGSCASLFAQHAGLVHYTSTLRYPVYLNGANYSGSPAMTTTPLLRRQITTYLAAEARQLPDAVWIPLGPAAGSALALLAGEGILRRDRILDGLPHPSGANGERIAYFMGRKAQADLSVKTRPLALDAARERLRQLVSAI